MADTANKPEVATTTRREVWARAWKDWSGRHWLPRTIGLVLAGPLLRFAMERHMTLHDLLVGALYGVVAAFSWGLLTFVGSLLTARGKILAERDQNLATAHTRIQELEAGRPRLSACLNHRKEQGILLLAVSNTGAPADVWAKISVSGDARPKVSSVFAAWKDEEGEKVRLATGETKEIIISERQTFEHFSLTWSIPFISGGAKQRSCSPVPTSLFENTPSPIRSQVKIEILSEPASLQPAINCSITLVGYDEWDALLGVPVCPNFAVTDDPHLEWQLFYESASRALALLSILDRQGQRSRKEEWDMFKDDIRRALSLAASLQEFRREARALLLPFLLVDEAATLADFSKAIEDLTSWLETTNTHVLTERWSSPPPPSSMAS